MNVVVFVGLKGVERDLVFGSTAQDVVRWGNEERLPGN